MAAVTPDPKKIRSFRTAAAFAAWLAAHHDRETEIWLKIHKKASGRATVTCAEALDVVLCWGWIDGIRKTCTTSMKTAAGRARKIATLVAMLARGETIVPEKPRRAPNAAGR